MAEPVVSLGKEHGYIKPGGILEGDELHGLPIFGMHCFFGHRPANSGYPLAHMGGKFLRLDILKALQDSLVPFERVTGEVKTKGIQLVSQHEVFGIDWLLK